MSVEKRDFVIERLERQLQDKDREFEELKVTLKDSIMTELRRDLQNDLDMNNRLIKMEQKVSELSNTLNGMMDELLDQKSELRSTRSIIGQKNNSDNRIMPKDSTMPALQKPMPNSKAHIAQPHIPTSASTSDQPYSTAPMSKPDPVVAQRQNNAQFNIREVKRKETEPQIPEPEPKTEYIIAESGERHQGHSIRNNRPTQKSGRSEYIIAENQNDVRRGSKTEHGFETVEKRDGEDVEITTNRKKSGF